MTLPPPATEAGIYLKAVLDELRALRVAVEGGPREQAPTAGPVDLTEPDPPATTKRTRTRVRG